MQLAATTLFSPKNFHAEISLLMETYYNWGELLAPAPVAISTLGQLILMPRRHGILLPCISDVVFRHQSRSLVPTSNRYRCDIGYVSRICRNCCVVTLRRTKITPTSDHDKEFKQFFFISHLLFPIYNLCSSHKGKLHRIQRIIR